MNPQTNRQNINSNKTEVITNTPVKSEQNYEPFNQDELLFFGFIRSYKIANNHLRNSEGSNIISPQYYNEAQLRHDSSPKSDISPANRVAFKVEYVSLRKKVLGN